MFLTFCPLFRDNCYKYLKLFNGIHVYVLPEFQFEYAEENRDIEVFAAVRHSLDMDPQDTDLVKKATVNIPGVGK